MKTFRLGSALLVIFFYQTAYCDFSPNFVDLSSSCSLELKRQIKMEVNASLTYLQMAVHFALPMENRPGFSDFFFKSANEEREHAIKFLDYLMMRGGETDISDLTLPEFSNKNLSLDSGINALNTALEAEVAVTNSIKSIVKSCESDYHLADYLTTEFLDEQYKGMRHIAGMISTLLHTKINNNSRVDEFLFDKKILKGELFH